MELPVYMQVGVGEWYEIGSFEASPDDIAAGVGSRNLPALLREVADEMDRVNTGPDPTGPDPTGEGE